MPIVVPVCMLEIPVGFSRFNLMFPFELDGYTDIQRDPKVPVQEDISNNSSAYTNKKYQGFRIFPWLSNGDLDHDLDHDLQGQMRSNSIFLNFL